MLQETSKGVLKEMLAQGKFTVKELLNLTPAAAFEIYQEQFADLNGIPIGRTDAARKYGFTEAAIRKWEQKGLVKVLPGTLPSAGRRDQVAVNERDVAVMAAMQELKIRKFGPLKGWKQPDLKVS